MEQVGVSSVLKQLSTFQIYLKTLALIQNKLWALPVVLLPAPLYLVDIEPSLVMQTPAKKQGSRSSDVKLTQIE